MSVKRLALVEIETSDDGRACSPKCGYYQVIGDDAACDNGGFFLGGMVDLMPIKSKRGRVEGHMRNPMCHTAVSDADALRAEVPS